MCISTQNLFLFHCDSTFKKRYIINTAVQLEDSSEYTHLHKYLIFLGSLFSTSFATLGDADSA